MADADPHGSFDEIRDEVDGNPMAKLIQYAIPYWLPLCIGFVSTMINRAARLFPALMLAAAIDLVITQSAESINSLRRQGLSRRSQSQRDRPVTVSRCCIISAR